MLIKHKAFSLLFFIVYSLLLASAFFQDAVLYQVARPFMVLSLLIYFIVKIKLKGRFHKRLFIGLLFAFLADLLLAFYKNSASLSVYTYSAYSLAAIFYIRAFYLDFRSAQELDKRGARIGIACCTILGMGFYIYLRPHVREEVFAVMLATFLICMLLMMSIFRNQRVNKISFNLILAGCICLALTLALFAIKQFVVPFTGAHLVVFTGYLLGQYLIVMGGIERHLIHK
ncbi:lysoplasmalogenase family protein [Pedobacter sp.]|uniref:lysoplasmalogenase family protein n=1 Tax=Pedobacter sp. TaxID=1411316 RepID=UPI003D7F3690